MAHCGRQNNGSPKDVHALLPRNCEYVVIWEGGIKAADGIEVANQLTGNGKIILGYLVGPM